MGARISSRIIFEFPVRRQIKKATRKQRRPPVVKYYPAEPSSCKRTRLSMDPLHPSLENLILGMDECSSPDTKPTPTLLSCDPLQVWGMSPDPSLAHSAQSVSSSDAGDNFREVLRAINAMREELFLTRTQVDTLKHQVDSRFNSIDFRVAKKNRTQENRCTFVNKKGGQCRGYICKAAGSILCYAHHVMATSLTDTERRKKLF